MLRVNKIIPGLSCNIVVKSMRYKHPNIEFTGTKSNAFKQTVQVFGQTVNQLRLLHVTLASDLELNMTPTYTDSYQQLPSIILPVPCSDCSCLRNTILVAVLSPL